MWFFYEHLIDPIKERDRKFGRIMPVDYGTEYPSDGRENLFFVVTYLIRQVVFAGIFLIDSFDELPDSLGEDDAGKLLFVWFRMIQEQNIDTGQDVVMGDASVIVVSEHDREPVGFLIVPDMRPVFSIGYRSDEVSQFLFPAEEIDIMTHGTHTSCRVDKLVRNRHISCVWTKKNPDYRDSEETGLEAGKKPSCFGRFMAWVMFPLIAIRLSDSIEDLIFLGKAP
ncbi:MAG: hypothetical protein QG664_669 [Patescibacteria group bacterium]|nr:hypothetical protein [Patescibacteria group bacterium]